MEKRTYKKFTDVYRDLQQYCSNLAKSGGEFLPNERELARLLQCSRMTLRKALALGIRQQMFQRHGRFLKLNHSRHDLAKLGRILFVSTGKNSDFSLKAFRDIYQMLLPELQKYNADIELLLTDRDTPLQYIVDKCRESAIVLFTLFLCSEPDNDRIRSFWEIAKSSRVIALSDPYQEYFYNYIALDNSAVGTLAAQALQRAGCRKVACIGKRRENMIFNKRCESFCDYMQNAEIEVWCGDPLPLSPWKSGDFQVQIRKALQKKCDGIFLVSDEHIGEITGEWFVDGVFAGGVKLITVNGCGGALQHDPPISCIGHGTRQLVQELLTYLIRLSEHPDWPDCRKLIVPGLCRGKTL